MKLSALLLFLLPVALVAQTGTALQTAPVSRGLVLSVRSVTTEDPGLAGAIIGGTAGGVVGHQFGKGNGKTAATVAGAIVGAVAGAKIEQNATRRNAQEITVQTEGGATLRIIQSSNEILAPGDKVYLIPDAHGATHVERAPADLELQTQQPTPVAQAPQVPLAATIPDSGQEVVVNEAPPPPPQEVVMVQPGEGYVWIDGYYEFRAGRYFWMPGHWERPVRPGAMWIRPRWEHRDHHYIYVPGRWHYGPHARMAPQRPEVMIVAAPPAPQREFCDYRGRPSPRHVWIDGYWSIRDGHHHWVAGCWAMPPRMGAVWVKPRWDHHDHGYVFVQGYWR